MPSLLARLAGALSRAPHARVPEAKESRAGAMIALHATGRPRWTPRDYAALAREGYERNAVVYRCVRMIAEAAATIPWRLYQGRAELIEHPLLDLLRRPNPHEDGASFLEALFGHLLVSGNAYVECASIDGRPRELYALRPDRIRIVPGANGWAEAYDYVVGADRVRYDMRGEGVKPILHMKMFSALDDHYGFSPIAAAQVALDIHNAAGSWNKALLDNAARPSGALVYAGESGHLSDDQFERLKRELEESFQGPRNAGRPLLLEGGLDWKPLSLTPKDMDFMAAKAGAAREIALAFGVPPLMLGLPGDNTHANFAEANRAFWRQTAIPLTMRAQRAIEAWLGGAYDPGLRLDVDLDRIDALSDERAREWARLEAASFLTVDEKREAAGYGAKDGAGAKA
ncbi:MAG: phage portal protein [Rhizobiales bacterium]|nr:phage portal protein [Hyphomicrobiales bacterium]